MKKVKDRSHSENNVIHSFGSVMTITNSWTERQTVAFMNL